MPSEPGQPGPAAPDAGRPDPASATSAARDESAAEPFIERVEEPIVAPPERLRRFLTRRRMLLGFALSVMVAVLITRLFSMHLSHNFGVVRTHAHEPEFFGYAVLCVLLYLAADTATLVLLARVLKSTVRARPLVLLSLRANFVAARPRSAASRSPIRPSRCAARGSVCPRRPRSSW